MGLIAACETSDNCRMRDAVSTVMAHRDGLLGWARKFMAKEVYTSFSKTALLPGFTERAAALGWGTPRRVLASDEAKGAFEERMKLQKAQNRAMTAARTRRMGPWDYGRACWSECAAVESGSHRCACSADCRSKQNWVGDGVDVPWKHVPPRRHGHIDAIETSQEWRNDPKLKPPKRTAASTKRITPAHLFTVKSYVGIAHTINSFLETPWKQDLFLQCRPRANHDYWLHALETPELDIGSSSVAISPNSSADGGPLTQCAFEAASNN